MKGKPYWVIHPLLERRPSALLDVVVWNMSKFYRVVWVGKNW